MSLTISTVETATSVVVHNPASHARVEPPLGGAVIVHLPRTSVFIARSATSVAPLRNNLIIEYVWVTPWQFVVVIVDPTAVDGETPVPVDPVEPVPAAALLTSEGEPIMTSYGEYILISVGAGIPAGAMLTEDGQPLLTEDGQILTIE